MPKGDDADTSAGRERLMRAARRYMSLRDTYDVLEHEHRYPMLQRMLSTRLSARTRAKAALEYAEQVLGEDGLRELAERVKDVNLDKRRQGAPRTRWGREEQESLTKALAEIFAEQKFNRKRINISAACRELESKEPWISSDYKAQQLRSQFACIARFNKLHPKAVAERLAEEDRIARSGSSKSSGSRPQQTT